MYYNTATINLPVTTNTLYQHYTPRIGQSTAPLQMTADQFDDKSLFNKMEHGSPLLYHGVFGPGTPPVYIVSSKNKATPAPPATAAASVPADVAPSPPPPPAEKSILVDVPNFTNIVYPAESSSTLMAENILHKMQGDNSFLSQSVTTS